MIRWDRRKWYYVKTRRFFGNKCPILTCKKTIVTRIYTMDEKWPNYQGMAARYWMSHQYHLAFYFWWLLLLAAIAANAIAAIAAVAIAPTTLEGWQSIVNPAYVGGLLFRPKTCCAWAGGTFISSCAVVSVFGLWREIVLGITYLPYQLCRCVLFLVAAGNSFGLHRSVFWLWRETVLGVSLIYHTSCAVVSVFGCGRK